MCWSVGFFFFYFSNFIPIEFNCNLNDVYKTLCPQQMLVHKGGQTIFFFFFFLGGGGGGAWGRVGGGGWGGGGVRVDVN